MAKKRKPYKPPKQQRQARSTKIKKELSMDDFKDVPYNKGIEINGELKPPMEEPHPLPDIPNLELTWKHVGFIALGFLMVILFAYWVFTIML